ncbi:hypothetical protein QTI66_31710 [Variovorax sp. J22R133]|uniref:hypothetical protein n=1 Tax=Variovorax brevis TaxID=3053503 RepID=UPI00257523FA|nr:hypothetical protein [Variovorax sp. J22R133]MDM0116707.1 hypothetical protein [Variovorax sp. J22R133]
MTDYAPPKAKTPPTDSTPCADMPKPPDVPGIPDPPPCPTHCECPTPPGGTPSSCLDDLIKSQNHVVKKAERAKALVDELTAIQADVVTAQASYTPKRHEDLTKLWTDQDKAIKELIRKVVCAVPCWECVLDCHLCKALVEIRNLDARLNGPSDLDAGMGLPQEAHSLYDQQYWHQRNVVHLLARVDRIKSVLEAWKDPSKSLGDVLDANQKLIDDTAKIVATDPAKALFDIFMTLLPRHWFIRPREAESGIDPKYIPLCGCAKDDGDTGQDGRDSDECGDDDDDGDGDDDGPGCHCDDGTPDDCCGLDVGILNLRQRLLGRLPYIVDPKRLPEIICCLTKHRLQPASDLLAHAQAQLAASNAEIDAAVQAIKDKTQNILATYTAGLPVPFDCKPYCVHAQPKEPKEPKEPEPPESCPPTATKPNSPNTCDPKAQAR